MTRAQPHLGAAVLALVPMAFAVLGGALDERAHLGYTLWRAACRAAGVTTGSLLVFTLELLPGAVIGALLGGSVLMIAGVVMWYRTRSARAMLSAHAGCTFGMAGGLLICAFVPSLPLMLVGEALLASGLTLLLCGRCSRASGASVRLPTSAPSSAY